MSSAISQDPALPALGTMLVLGGTPEGYVDGASRTGIADHEVEGMVLHWSGQLSEGTLTGTVWREHALAEQYLAEVLAEAFTAMAGSEEQVNWPRPDYSYEMSSLLAFVPGADAARAGDRKLGEAAGAVLARPVGELAGINLENGAPEGLIAHVVAGDGDEVSWIDVWLDRAALEGLYDDLDALEIIPLHTLIVNVGELDQFQRFPPAE